MSREDLADFTIQPGARLLDAAEAIVRNRSRAIVVMDDDRVVGVISEGDILRALLQGAEIHAPLRDHIKYGLRYLDDADLDKALALFVEHNISLVPVVDADFRLSAVITLQEVLKWLAERP